MARSARINKSAAFVAAFLMMMGVAAGSWAATAPPLHLSGAVRGRAIALPTNADAGAEYSLRASGSLNIGRTTISGSVHGAGFIAVGHCTGSLDLRTAAGTLRLTLRSSSAVKGFTMCTAYSWVVTASSGRYAGRRGSGVVRVIASPNAAIISFGNVLLSEVGGW